MSEISKDQFLKDFSKAILDDSAALFVGAGISVGAGFVDWNDLLRDIAKDLGLNVDEESDLISLAQYEYNRNQSRTRLNHKIVEEFTERVTLSETHKWIARLPIDTIWSTNYDKLIETAFEKVSKCLDVKSSVPDLLRRKAHADATLYKMHGDVDKPDEAILIKDDYELYDSKKGLFTSQLQGDLSWRQFLFLGFSFNDPNIEYVFSRLRCLLEENAKNQPTRYCIIRKPKPPKKGSKNYLKYKKDYDLERKRLPHRIADLGRFNIDVVLVKEFSEIETILQDLYQRVALQSVFISGSAAEFSPLGKEKTENFCRELGKQIIERGYNLVSGFGLGISGSCIIGAHEQLRRNQGLRKVDRLRLHPFPQEWRNNEERLVLFSQIREELTNESGVTIFISGNKYDPKSGKNILASGVLEEFRMAKRKKHILIPIPATGWAAEKIYKVIEKDFEKYYNKARVKKEFEILSSLEKSSQWTEAIFSILSKVGNKR